MSRDLGERGHDLQVRPVSSPRNVQRDTSRRASVKWGSGRNCGRRRLRFAGSAWMSSTGPVRNSWGPLYKRAPSNALIGHLRRRLKATRIRRGAHKTLAAAAN